MAHPEPTKVYEGKITTMGHAIVTVNGRILPLHLDEQEISPTGFQWGYGGAGPRQLAVALAHDLSIGSSVQILNKIVKVLKKDQPWILTDMDIRLIVEHGGCLPEQA